MSGSGRITAAGVGRLWSLVAERNVPVDLLLDGRYRVSRRLGTGGMGDVFLADDIRLNRPVAMKFLEMPGEGWAARFEAEAKTLGRLEHEGIVPVFDLGLLPDGRLYYAMKYVAGSTLEALISSGTDRRGLLRILEEACRIVAHAHAKGVLHRDLKPGNIMVGERDRVFVMDWGIARLRDDVSELAGPGVPSGPGRTSVSTILGTPEYMSPEQARGERDKIDERSDVYSLGAILHEIVTGRPPGSGPSSKSDFDLEAIQIKCLEPEPDRRYASARDLADDLSRYLAGEAILAHPPSTMYRLKKYVARRRTSAVLAAAALLAAIVSGILAPQWMAERRRARLKDEQLAAEKERKSEELRQVEAARPYLREGGFVLEEMRIKFRDPDYKPLEILALAARAEARFKDALREHPDDADAWLGIGRAWRLAGEDVKARGALDRAISISPGFSTAYLERARIYLIRYAGLRHEVTGEVRKETPESSKLRALIESDLQEVERTTKKSHEKLFARGVLAVAEGKYGEAAELLKQYVEERPEEPEAHLVLGYIFLSQKDYDRAIEALTKSLEGDGRCAVALLNRSSANLDKGLLDAAIADCDRALKIKDDSPELYVNRGNVRRARGDVDGAIADFDRAIKMRPDFAEAFVNRGNARQAKGGIDGALADYDRAVELRKDLAEAYSNRGNARHAKGDLVGAMADYDAALAIRDIAEARYTRGTLKVARGDLNGGIADLDRAIELRKDFADAYDQRGLARRHKSDLNGAIADFNRAVEINKDFAEAYFDRGETRQAGGDLDGAWADYDRAIEIKKDFAEAYSNRGVIKRIRGNPNGAIEDYDRAVAIRKDFAEAYNGRGLAKWAKGDVDGAIADYSLAIAAKKELSEAYANRANARRTKGDLNGAIADFDRALEFKKDFAWACLSRGMAKSAKGDLDGAIADYRRTLEMAPRDWSYRATAQQCLDSALLAREKKP